MRLPGGIGGQSTRVALVHFSSPDQRTRVEWNLNSGLNAMAIQQTLNNLPVSSVLGVSDLDLYVYLCIILQHVMSTGVCQLQRIKYSFPDRIVLEHNFQIMQY